MKVFQMGILYKLFLLITVSNFMVPVYGAGQISKKAPTPASAPAKLKNCAGLVTARAASNYYIENAIGDGLTLQGDNSDAEAPTIDGATGNGITIPNGGTYVHKFVVKNVAGCGMVITGDNCIIQDGVIDGAGGVGLLVKGSKNAIHNVRITNCRTPIVIEGEGNIVGWDTNSTQPDNLNAQAQARTQNQSRIQVQQQFNEQNANAVGESMSVSGKITQRR